MDVKNRLLSIIYPHRCFICDEVLPFPEEICEKCKKQIIDFSKIRGAVCDICGLKLSYCNCAASRYYSKAVFPFLYENDVRRSLHRLKFRGRLDKVKPFAGAMYNALLERNISDTDILTFIPMSKISKYNRGYNQAELLCKELSRLSGISYLPLLCKFGKNAKQHSLKMTRRHGNVLGMYEPDKRYIEEIKGKNILIVDDILTTGATLSEAAKTLLIFGAEKVYVISAAARNNSKKPAD
ncbi:MAG: ComF family protein [Oscillospiraceae bacterium]|nr:ComF family protein [Oscillospiraceae bacterium]